MAILVKYRIAFVIPSVLLIAFACSELRDEFPFIPGSVVTYEADVKQIFDTQCISCHSGTNPPGDYDLSTFIGILDTGVDNIPNAIPGDASSLLLQKINPAGSMNQYIGLLDNADVLFSWIIESRLGLGDFEEHPAGWTNPADDNFHGLFLRQTNFNLDACTECHSVDYTGGISNSSCLVCHTETPEDCTTCHGRSYNPSGAPPKDVDGNVLTTNRTVGAHASHLEGGKFSRPVECGECHTVPSRVDEDGHIDSSPHAELNFGSLATNLGAESGFNQDFTCSNVYCHGAFPAGRQDNAPLWTDVDGGQAGCGTCHGLPPSGQTRNGISHPGLFDCSICHSSVVATNLPIISDRSKHINGEIDF